MKISRALGFGIFIIVLTFLMPEVLSGFEGALKAFFLAASNAFSTASFSMPPLPAAPYTAL